MKKILLKNIHQIISYNQWANQRLIENINKITDEDYHKILPIPFNNIHGLLLHLYYYDTKHYQELTNLLNPHAIEKKFQRGLLAERILLSSSIWITWIENLIPINQSTDFFEKTLKNISDLSAHNNYHRGQINIIASILGYKPESLDIFLYNDETFT
jgi:uncharacterized damage-inducible protein DinB